MLNELAPTYQAQFTNYIVNWFKTSNSYSIIDSDFNKVLAVFLNSTDFTNFKVALNKLDTISDPKIVAQHLTTYLKQSNIISPSEPQDSQKVFTSKYQSIKKRYLIDNKHFEVYYCSEKVKQLIHPAIAQYTCNTAITSVISFDIYLENDALFLYMEKELITTVPKEEYHKIQGKFTMCLLCALHNKTEKDWIGTFHGSTISDGKHSILCIGKSGSGKSTLCTLLAQHKFKLVADDVSPMLSKDTHIYNNPNAVSIKYGAFETLKPHITNFDALTEVKFQNHKGLIKHIPSTLPFIAKGYPCKAILLVNYKKNAETRLEKIAIKEVLETLIPDSWLSHNAVHAKQFLDWLLQTTHYKLTYSNTNTMVNRISKLFNSFDNIQQ